MEKILVLNNDPDTMELLEQLLELKGFEVKFTAVREEIAGLITGFAPELVLLDITRQEEMDEIKQEATSEQIPVLLMTGHNNYPERKENGFSHFIKKPFTLDQLLDKINTVLKK